MKVYTSLRELEYTLPNGFHDASLETVMINYASSRVELDLRLHVGTPDAATKEERDAYRKARLCLNDFVYFVIDPPGAGHESPEAGALWLRDAGDATDESYPAYLKPRSDLPDSAFAYWFYVDEWNSHIHVAAKGASLEWL